MRFRPDHRYRPLEDTHNTTHPHVKGLRYWKLFKGGFALDIHFHGTRQRAVGYNYLSRDELKGVVADYLALAESDSPMKLYVQHLRARQ
jgi:hypothetical protein